MSNRHFQGEGELYNANYIKTQPLLPSELSYTTSFQQQSETQYLPSADAVLNIEVSNQASSAVTCVAPGVYGRSTKERLFPKFKHTNLVFIFSCLQLGIYFLTVLVTISSMRLATTLEQHAYAYTCVLLKFGAKFTPSILLHYQYHRLVMPIMLHIGFNHVAGNIFFQNMYGHILEEHYGRAKILVAYIAAGVGGNLLSAIALQNIISVGASSSLYGLLALSVAYIFGNYEKFESRKNVVGLIIVAITGVGFLPYLGVDIYGHYGGFITGSLIAVLYSNRSGNLFKVFKIIAGIGLAAYYVGLFAILIHLKENKSELISLENSINSVCSFI